MSRRLQGGLAVLLLAVAGLITWQTLAVREPSYHGQSLSAWLAQLGHGDLQSSAMAAQAVRAIGTNALPALFRKLRASDPFWKQAVLNLNARQSWFHLPVMPASVARARAVQGFRVLGTGANESIPELVRLMESEGSPEVRTCIAAVLGGFGPDARAALPVLLKATEDRNAEVRKSAVIAIANIRMWSPDRL